MNPLDWNASWPIVFGALFCIVMARANATYWAGRAIVMGAERTRASRLLHSRGYHRAQRWLRRWGAGAVTACFLTIGIQTLVNLAAGVTRMPLRQYLPAVVLGCLLWAALYASVGLAGVDAIVLLWRRSPLLAAVLAVVLVGGAAAFVIHQSRAAHQPDDAA